MLMLALHDESPDRGQSSHRRRRIAYTLAFALETLKRTPRPLYLCQCRDAGSNSGLMIEPICEKWDRFRHSHVLVRCMSQYLDLCLGDSLVIRGGRQGGNVGTFCPPIGNGNT